MTNNQKYAIQMNIWGVGSIILHTLDDGYTSLIMLAVAALFSILMVTDND